MSTPGGGTNTGGSTTGGTTEGSTTGGRVRDFLAETMDPDAAQNRQSLRRISAKKLLAAVSIFFVGIATTYFYNHILADDAAKVADAAADNLDKTKPAVDANLNYIPVTQQWAKESDYWEFDRILTQDDVDAINNSNTNDTQLRKKLSELGGRRVLGRRGDPQNAPLPYLSMQLELSSQRNGLITIQRIYAKTIRCADSTAKSALTPAPVGGVSNREGLIFDFTQAKNAGDTVEATDDASRKPYAQVKGISLRSDLEPVFMNVSVASERGCEWSLHLKYHVSADRETKDITVKVGKKNPEFKFTPFGGGSQLIARDSDGIYSIIP